MKPINRNQRIKADHHQPIQPATTISFKQRTRIAQWNVRTLTDDTRIAQLEQQMNKYNIQIFGLSEVRRRNHGEQTTSDGNTLIYSGKPDKSESGVAIMMSKAVRKSLIEWSPVSDRIITARVKTKARNMSIVQCYAPTEVDTIVEKDAFYDELSNALNKVQKGDIVVLMGDFNAQIGSNNTGYRRITGKHGMGTRTDNGDRLVELCMKHDLIIGGTVFPHKDVHKYTWTSPNGRTKNQIDHICISAKWRSSLLDVRNKRGADLFTDHELILATIQLKIMAIKNRQRGERRTNINVDELKAPNKKREFSAKLNELIHQNELSWQECHLEAAKQTLGEQRRNKRKAWISEDTWQLIEQRRLLKERLNQRDHPDVRAEYNDMGKRVKRATRHDRRTHTNKLADEAEEAAQKHDMRTLYRKVRELAGGGKNNNNMLLEDKDGRNIVSIDDQRSRWREYFDELLNIPSDVNNETDDVPENDANTSRLIRIKKTEIVAAIKKLKTNKAPGTDSIQTELFKVNPTITAEALHEHIVEAWENEHFDNEWKRGVIVKIPKKGDLKKCGNWRGITVLNAINKVVAQIILQRITEHIESQLRDEQAGFRANRGCIDQSNTLRLIIEQSNEFQSPLYIMFVDFEKAFDRVNRGEIWKALASKGIPSKIIRVIRALYSEAKCSVLHKGARSEEFEVQNGVRQGCVLSPLLFITVLDQAIREISTETHGIWWNPTRKLGDLDFADDIALLTNSHSHMQSLMNNLCASTEPKGLNININKTKLMRINTSNTNNITVGTQVIEEVSEYCYLGSVMTKKGGTKEDISSRIAKARAAYGQLRTTWNTRQIATSTKIRIFKSCVLAVLLYGSETWSYTGRELSAAQVFVNKCLRRILGIFWPLTITNSQLYQQSNCEPLEQTIKRKRWSWIGHTLRKPHDSICRQALEWNPQGNRRRGRPKQTWRRRVDNELVEAGITWNEAKTTASNRTRWKALSEALCSTRS